MGARRLYRSISTPIVLGSITVGLTIFLLVGWILVSVRYMTLTRRFAENTFLLVAGLVSFAVILSVVVLFAVFLVREILEVRRQITFIDSVTHELKSPLASLRLCLETQARPELTIEQRERLRRMMLGDVDRLATFIDDVLESSRLAHGRRPYSLSEVQIAELVERCAALVRSRYGLAEDAIRKEIDPQLVFVTDASALETVLKNLLDNAVKYSDPPAQVTVRASRPDEGLHVEVEDAGIGIPPAQLKRVFERFYRVPADAVYARAGTGLGLFVVWSLVKNLGGTLEAQSGGGRKGTRMTLMLPPPAPPRT